MGIISRMAKPQAISQEMEKVFRSVFGGGSTYSGKSVSNETAMRQATVYSCVNILSRVIGMLPCYMMMKAGKVREAATDHNLYPLLHDMPNEWMTSSEFWGMAMNHLSLRGNFFALKNRGVYGREIKELIPLAPGVVQEIEQNADYTLTYKCIIPTTSNVSTPNGTSGYLSGGTRIDIPGSEIMHLRGMTMNGYMGVNPIEHIRESIGLALATEEFGARYFGTGTHPGMIIEHPSKLTDQAHKNLKDSLGEAYSGLGKSHRLMLLEEGMKAQAITIKPEDSQFLESRKYQKSEIVDIFFGLPLTTMSSGDNTPTFASAEQFSIGFVIYALLPWIVSIEKSIYRDLLSPADRKKYYAKFKVEGLQRGAFKDQMAAFATAIDKEILNPNEIREMLDFNPYEGGDVYRTRTSTTKESGTANNQDDEK